ncbi:hypothetical protein B0H67DRAFT_646595 [Lasiosphaeris hirsuta]|uniref:Uncharacterized protein n=1 Tax=Lasiosphaeris hirsuta TaxID=260670 RepID=A0AA40A8D4_9PEZI|nr:hypothetical protein B0H67DRAFT_646595 [Lasiosphaeris hirsuta]
MADKRAIAQLDRLSLPGVDKIIAEIRNRICGRVQVEEEWWCISLSLDEFKAFEARFEAEGNHCWPKYDYFPDVAKFVLRMAGDLHENAIKGYETQIIRQLFTIEQGNDKVATHFTQGIRAKGSIKVESKDGGVHRPDGSWMHKDATELGVILEVSHSQERQDLPFLADFYNLGSNGLTQMVIGLDLEYRKNKGKEARVIVWRPKQTKKKGKTTLETKKTFEGIFRNTDGSLANGKRNLRIWLKDFGKLDCPGIQKVQGAITISFTQLYKMVQDGEAMEQTRKRRRGSDEVLVGRNKELFGIAEEKVEK